MNCFKKTATDLAEDYGVPKQLVEGKIKEHIIWFINVLVRSEKTLKF